MSNFIVAAILVYVLVGYLTWLIFDHVIFMCRLMDKEFESEFESKKDLYKAIFMVSVIWPLTIHGTIEMYAEVKSVWDFNHM